MGGGWFIIGHFFGFFIPQLPEHVAELLVVWLVLVPVAEDFSLESLQVLSVAEAQILASLILLGFSDYLEFLIHFGLVADAHAREVSALEQEDNEVEEGDQVISSAGGVELQLVETGEGDVSAEDLELALFEMLLSLLVEVWAHKAEVYYVDILLVEDVTFAGLQVLGLDTGVEEKIIELEVIENVTSLMHLLENVENLDTKGVDGSS